MLLRASHFPSAITHGFTTRQGGVSTGRYASLNLGEKWGDNPDAVRENLRRVAEWADYEPDELVRVCQVHGDRVVHAVGADSTTEADGVWAHRDDPACVVGVMTADCVPLLICDRAGTVIAATHSGWRGTVANIAARTVETLVAHGGVVASELVAAIGPCIELAAFEVGDEVAEQFEPRFVSREHGPKPHIDLVACVRAQLEAAGLPSDQIERVGGCTHADPQTYFSYRRDGAGIGQQLSLIGWPRASRAS